MIHKRFMRLSIALLLSLSVLMSCATTGKARMQEPVYAVIAKIITDMFVKMNGGKAITDANLKAVAENYLTKTVGLTAPQINTLKQKLQ